MDMSERGEKKQISRKTITLFHRTEKEVHVKKKKESEISNLVTEMSSTSLFCTLPLIKLLLI